MSAETTGGKVDVVEHVREAHPHLMAIAAAAPTEPDDVQEHADEVRDRLDEIEEIVERHTPDGGKS